VDIRVKRPDPAFKAREAGERACDQIGCERAGAHRAPKSRESDKEFWWFCSEHAGDYNRRWNFFRDMSEDEYEAFKHAEEIGHRPTWTFRPGRNDRVSAGRFWQSAKKGDRFGVFGGFAQRAEPRKPRIGRVQELALHVLALEVGAEPAAIRQRYAELVKRYHPDSNQGDRTAETQLNKVLKAYQTLKAAGLA
jgi:DnaJ-domain-containing protein 1